MYNLFRLRKYSGGSLPMAFESTLTDSLVGMAEDREKVVPASHSDYLSLAISLGRSSSVSDASLSLIGLHVSPNRLCDSRKFFTRLGMLPYDEIRPQHLRHRPDPSVSAALDGTLISLQQCWASRIRACQKSRNQAPWQPQPRLQDEAFIECIITAATGSMNDVLS